MRTPPSPLLWRDQLLTSSEVCQRTGLTYRQLDYWTRQGFVEPVVAAAGQGSNRLFDAAAVRAIKRRLAALDRCPSCSDPAKQGVRV